MARRASRRGQQRPTAGLASGAPEPQASTGRISVKISRDIADDLLSEAKLVGMSAPSWVNSLLRRRLQGRPVLRREEELAIIAIQMELRRIGVQARQVLNQAEDKLGHEAMIGAEVEQLAHLHEEIRGHLGRLRAALAGNLDYWESRP